MPSPTRAAKDRWFAGPDEWTLLERAMAFKPGGRERAKGRFPNGTVTEFDAYYWDIVPDARIVYAYEMHIDGKKISVSLATITFAPAGKGTLLTVHEDGAFLDGYDDNASREHGTNWLMDKLIETLKT